MPVNTFLNESTFHGGLVKVITFNTTLKEKPTRNPLQETNFRFDIKRMPHVSYFCTNVTIPTLSLNVIEVPNPFQRYPEPGVQLTFSELSLQFIVDEDLKNYNEMYDWIAGLTFPETFDQYRDLRDNSPSILLPHRVQHQRVKSDCTLFIQTSHLNNNIEVTFRDIHPINISGYELVTNKSEPDYLTATATFAVHMFDIEKR